MKLVAFVFAALLLPVAAHAEEVLNPPGGPVFQDADYRPVAGAQPRHGKGELRRALLQRFDRDGDGRLNGRERKRAARVLARLQARLEGHHQRDPQARQQRREMRQQRREMRRQRGQLHQQNQLDQRDVQVDVDVR